MADGISVTIISTEWYVLHRTFDKFLTISQRFGKISWPEIANHFSNVAHDFLGMCLFSDHIVCIYNQFSILYILDCINSSHI